jgi:hypothetical protein
MNLQTVPGKDNMPKNVKLLTEIVSRAKFSTDLEFVTTGTKPPLQWSSQRMVL